MKTEEALQRQHAFFNTLHGSLFSDKTIPEYMCTLFKAAGCTDKAFDYNKYSTKKEYSRLYQLYRGSRFMSQPLRRTFPEAETITTGISDYLSQVIDESPEFAMQNLRTHFGISEITLKETVVEALAQTFRDIVKLLPNETRRDWLSDEWGNLSLKCLEIQQSTQTSLQIIDSVNRHTGTLDHPARYIECERSWKNLGEIAGEISRMDTRDDILSFLCEQGLASSDGQLVKTRKGITLKNGIKTHVRIVGFAHDITPEGRKAGLTFGFQTSLGEVCMNPTKTNKGGWKDSHLRSWLDRKLIELLPDDLAERVLPVCKMTNNVGCTTSFKDVTETVDSLWLFSRIELSGRWNAKDVWPESPEAPLYDLIADSEGHQYELFSQLGVDDPYGRKAADFSRQSPIVAYGEGMTPTRFWLRSPDPDNETQFGVVKKTGEIANGFGSTGQYSIIPGFCI